MKKLIHLYWKYFNRPEIPPQDFPIIPRINTASFDVYVPEYLKYTIMYRNEMTLEEIAEKQNKTRERIRQCLWKAYWMYYE